jgi:predicted TIM-barrel fold metal-dependent hydrolase
MMNDATFRQGFAKLRNYSLSFDAWVYHPQLGDLLALARAFPDVPIVVNHLGGPIGIRAYADRSEDVYDHWKSSIDALSGCQNVWMKLGGLNMPLSGIRWSQNREALTAEEINEKTRRYYLYAIDKFSPARCMFESNFPVDKHSCTYKSLWQAFDLMTQGFSSAESAAMFGATATRFYRLNSITSDGPQGRS